MVRERQSNIEALRIVCMLFIVMHHSIAHGLSLSEQYVPQMGWEWDFTQLINAFCYCAVNVFILISGYFGIKPKVKSFANLYLMLGFYVFVLYHAYLYVTGGAVNRWSLLYAIMPVSYAPGWWFIKCYVLLYLVSPILNAAIGTFDRKRFQWVLILLMIVNLYFGFYRNWDFANYGFSISHFIFMYFIGAFIHKYDKAWRRKFIVRQSQYIYIIGSVILGLLTILNVKYWHNTTSAWLYTVNYNHPLLILNSIGIFLFFLSLGFRSRVINYVAPSVLAVYLIHECEWFSSSYYEMVARCWESCPEGILRFLFLFVWCIGVFLISVAVDQLRKIVTKPIVEKVEGLYQKCKDKWRQ